MATGLIVFCEKLWREYIMKKCIMNKNISTHWLVGVMVIGAIVTGCGNKHAESKNDTNVIELLNVSYDPTR